MDAHKWLEQESSRLMDEGQRWTKANNRPWGDIIIPREGLSLDKPLIVPLRCNLIREQTFLTDAPCFDVGRKFPQGKYAIEWEPSRSRGNFSQGLRNISISCNYRANGIRLSGDQESAYDGLWVDAYYEVGVWASLTHGSSISRLSIRGSYGTYRGTGLLVYDSSAATIYSPSFNWCGVGIAKERCSTVRDIGASFEHVAIPWTQNDCRSCHSEGHTMLSNTGGYVAQLTNSWGASIQGTIRNSARARVEVDNMGTPVLVCSRGHLQKAQSFEFDPQRIALLDRIADLELKFANL